MRSFSLLALAVMASLCSRVAVADPGFEFSAGPSRSQYSAKSVFNENNLAGAMVESRMLLPWHLYGVVQIRSEQGKGVQSGISTTNDYLRVLAGGGVELDLWLGFKGAIGIDYTQSDLDIGATVDGKAFTLSRSRQAIGGRARLSRNLGTWARVSAESEYNLVEQAIGGIYDVESGSRFGPWSLAWRYSLYPFLRQSAVLLRYRFPLEKPAPEPRPDLSKATVPADLQPETSLLLIDPGWTGPRGLGQPVVAPVDECALSAGSGVCTTLYGFPARVEVGPTK